MKGLIRILIFLSVFIACNDQKLNKTETEESDENELLYGLHLGMSLQEFYDYCWNKNQEGLFHDGGFYHQVMVEIEDGFSHPVQFFFLSLFDEKDILYAQKCKFRYKNWAPWKEDTYNDKLMGEVLHFLKPYFGDDFEQSIKKKTLYYLDIDGRRKVELYTMPLDDTYVHMDIYELRSQ